MPRQIGHNRRGLAVTSRRRGAQRTRSARPGAPSCGRRGLWRGLAWALCLAGALGAEVPSVAGAHPGPAGDISLLGRPQAQVFTDREGLRQNSVEAVAMDDQGYAWIGTQDGAMRYDGRSWTPVDMPRARVSNWVTAMVLQPGGPRWFATNNAGIARWDGAWTVFDTSAGLPSDSIYRLVAGAGSLWAGTAAGPARWTGTRWRAFPRGEAWTHGPVRALLVRATPQGREVWVGADGGLGCLRGEAWTWYGQAGLPSAMVTALLEGEPERGQRPLWVGTQRGLAVGEPGRWRRTGAGVLPHPAVTCLLRTESRQGRPVHWVGTEGGLVRWEGARHRHWGLGQGLGSPVVRSLLVRQDASGRETVWVGTFGGLVRFTEGTWASLDAQDGLPDNLVFSFHEDRRRQRLWFGTFHGLVSYQRGQWAHYGPAEGLPKVSIFALAGSPEEDVLWVGTRGQGLFRVAGGRAQPVPGLPDSFVYALHASQDAAGRPVVWAGTRAGLSRWQGGTWTHFGAGQRVPKALVSSITEVDGPGGRQLWVGTRGAGLGVLGPGETAFTWFDGAKGLVDPRVMHLLATEEDGQPCVWVSTQGGLQAFRAQPPGPMGPALTPTSTPALPGEVVYTAQRGADGALYAFTNHGVWRWGPQGPGVRDTQTFTTGDGLPSNGCVQGASLVDAQGRIWAGTVLGVAILDPSASFVDTESKPLYLAEARNGERPLDLHGPWQLPWRARNLQLRFSLLSYHREADTRFQSQLLGLEPEPTPWQASSEREFVSLPAGEYRLRVWGRDHAGNVSGPLEVPLSVQAPPWLRWWALVGYVLLLTLLVLLLILWRVSRLQHRNTVLARRVHQATAALRRQNETLGRINQHLGRLNEEKSHMLGIAAHDLRNPLNGISLYAEILLGGEGPATGTAPDSPARRILKLARDMGLLIERLLNTSRIDAGHLSLHMEAVDPCALLRELKERHAAAATAKGLALELDLPEAGLPPLLADPFHLMEALDNLVSNALKFMPSGPPQGRVVLRARAGVLEVQDEGPGFTEEDQLHAFERFRRLSAKPTAGEGSTGLGLSIVKALVEAMGGEIALESAPGRGATFRIQLGRP